MNPPVPPLPTFLIIGAQKSATRWLRLNLGRHPEIFTPERELEFFNYTKRFDELGVAWYREQFAVEGWAGEPIVGEATPGYMMPRHHPVRVANRIKEVLPTVRLIAVLRNPVDRAHSAMLHHTKRGRLSPGTRLLDLVRNPTTEHEWLGVVSGGQYAASLRPYIRRFGEQLLVLLHDDVRSDARRVYREALRHVGASTDFVPPELDEVVFSNRTRVQADVLTDDEREELYPYFAFDLYKLEELLDRDLSAWRPAGRAVLANDPKTLADLYRRVREWGRAVTGRIERGQFAAPTPCEQWCVRDIFEHMVRSLMFYSWSLDRDATEPLDPIAGQAAAEDDVLRDDPVGALDRAAEAFAAKLDEPGILHRTVPTNMGPTSSDSLVRIALVDQVAHLWDLAVATDQSREIPSNVVQDAEEIAYAVVPRTHRQPAWLLPVVEVDRAASPTERFVAYLGRDPARWCVATRGVG